MGGALLSIMMSRPTCWPAQLSRRPAGSKKLFIVRLPLSCVFAGSESQIDVLACPARQLGLHGVRE
eukprot:4798243-Pyramimonas_sp.AAC.1